MPPGYCTTPAQQQAPEQCVDQTVGLSTEAGTTNPLGNSGAAAYLEARTRGGGCYEVQDGDTLWGIAETTYGDGSLWTEIFCANPDEVREGNVIIVGDILVCPMLEVGTPPECTEPEPDAAVPAMRHSAWFADSVFAGDLVKAEAELPQLTEDDLGALTAVPGLPDAIVSLFQTHDALDLLERLCVDAWPVLVACPDVLVPIITTTGDPDLAALIADREGVASDVRPLVADNTEFALFLIAYNISVPERLALAGFNEDGSITSAADYDLLVRVLTDLDAAQREPFLVGMRQGDAWDDMLSNLGADHVALVQSWIAGEAGDGTGQTLQQRIDTAHNSDRGNDALARVQAVEAGDTNDPPRITDRIRELLVLGVALPKLENNDLAIEGVLGAVQAERAAQALINMPAQEYIRTVGLLSLANDDAALTQSFLMLKAVAARAGRFTDADASNDSVSELEDFSDAIRTMDQETAILNTSVTSVDPALSGLEQVFIMGCAPTSGITMRAEADPIEALALNDEGLDEFNTGGSVAEESEEVLERYGNHPGNNIAQLNRDSRDSLLQDVNDALANLVGTASADEIQAVRDYVQGNAAYDAAAYARGIAKVRTNLDMDGHPDDQSMRLLHETVAANGNRNGGMRAEEIADEYNNDNGINLDETTGTTYVADVDATLRTYRSTLPAPHSYPAALPNNISEQVDDLLDTAESDLEDGYDVGFGVLWSESGGHAMSFLNVDGGGNNRRFLIHNTGSGQTVWVSATDLRQARIPGIGRGLIYRLADPQ